MTIFHYYLLPMIHGDHAFLHKIICTYVGIFNQKASLKLFNMFIAKNPKRSVILLQIVIVFRLVKTHSRLCSKEN